MTSRHSAVVTWLLAVYVLLVGVPFAAAQTPPPGTKFEIMFFDGGVFTTIDSTGRVLRQVPLSPGGGMFSVSPDYSKLVYSANSNDPSYMWVYDFDHSTNTLLFQANWAQTVTWLPGSNSTFIYNTPSGNLLSYDIDTGQHVDWQSNDVLAPFGANVFRTGPFNWDASLQKVVFVAGVGGGGDNQFYIARPCESDSSHHLCDVLALGAATSWWGTINGQGDITPDGSKVYYARRENFTKWYLYEQDVSTGDRRTLLSGDDSLRQGLGGVSLFGDSQLVFMAPTSDPVLWDVTVCDITATLECRRVYTARDPNGVQTGRAINTVPVADAGVSRAVECAGAGGTPVDLDGSASSDADDDALTYTWTGPFPEGRGTVTGPAPTVTLPLGPSTITLVVNDGHVDSEPATVTVTVNVRVVGFEQPMGPLMPEGQQVRLPDRALNGGVLPLRFRTFCSNGILCGADIEPPRIVRLERDGEPLDLDSVDLGAGAPGDDGLVFRPAGGHWQHNLLTRYLAPGTYTITVQMMDNSRWVSMFVLR